MASPQSLRFAINPGRSALQPQFNELKIWPLQMPVDVQLQQTMSFDNCYALENQDPFSHFSTELSSVTFPTEPLSQFVQPQELYHASSSLSGSESSKSPLSQHDPPSRSRYGSSVSSVSEYLSLDRQRAIRRLSLATSELSGDTYLPPNIETDTRPLSKTFRCAASAKRKRCTSRLPLSILSMTRSSR